MSDMQNNTTCESCTVLTARLQQAEQERDELQRQVERSNRLHDATCFTEVYTMETDQIDVIGLVHLAKLVVGR